MIDGFLVIDKPAGLTSHDVVQRVRRWAKQRRVGHLGTLDPLATGVLPIALGEATKLSQLLTHGEKSYRGKIRLGIETTTYDREGEVVARARGAVADARAALERALAAFRGEIDQVPPPYSAVKTRRRGRLPRARAAARKSCSSRAGSRSGASSSSRYEPPFVSHRGRLQLGHLPALDRARPRARSSASVRTSGSCAARAADRSGSSQAIPLDELDALGARARDPDDRGDRPADLRVDARTARRVANGVQLGRHEVKGAPPEGILQLVHDGTPGRAGRGAAGLPELRTLRVFLEGRRGLEPLEKCTPGALRRRGAALLYKRPFFRR